MALPNNQVNPVISPNGQKIYFCSNGEGTMGGYDVFSTTFDSEKQEWDKPVNLGFPINTVFDDFLFIPNFEDNTALIASNRESHADSVRILVLDLATLADAEEIEDYGRYSAFEKEKKKELVTPSSNTTNFFFPVPDEEWKGNAKKIQEQAHIDATLLTDYRKYLENEIEACSQIGRYKETTAIKKRKEAEKLRASKTHLSSNTAKSEVEANYKKLKETIDHLEDEAEFTYSYQKHRKGYLQKVLVLEKQAQKLAIVLNPLVEIPSDFSKLKEAREEYNNNAVLFASVEQEIAHSHSLFTKKKDQADFSKSEIERRKKNIAKIEREIALAEREVAELSGNSQEEKADEIINLKKKLRDEKVKIQVSENNLSDHEKEASSIESYVRSLSLLNEELFSMRGNGFDFSKYYLQEEVVVEEPKKKEVVARSDIEAVYDFSGVDENKILNLILLDKKEKKTLEKAEKEIIKAVKVDEEVAKLKTEYTKLEDKAEAAKSKKRKKIRNQQKKLSEKIKAARIKAFGYRVKAFNQKYPVLLSHLTVLKDSNKIDSEKAIAHEEASRSKWGQGNRRWNRAVKKKSKRIASYEEAFGQVDTAYVLMFQTMAFYLDVLPEPSYSKPEKEEPKEQKIEKEIAVPAVVVNEEAAKAIEEEIEEEIDKGMFYSVQVAARKTEQIPQGVAQFNDVFVCPGPNGYFRFSAGRFETVSEATQRKQEIRQAGVSDAFVVAYHRDKRISLAEAKALTQSESSLPADQKQVAVKGISAVSGAFYTIQLGVFRSQPDFSKIPVIETIYSKTLRSGLTKYTYGKFTKYDEAQQMKTQIREAGIPDAFVVRVVEGAVKPADVNNSSQVAKVLKPQGSGIASITDLSGLFYSVQIGAFKQAQKSSRFAGISPVYYLNGESNYFRYYMGVYDDLSQASAAKNDVKQAGVVDAFVVGFYKGKKISIAEAKGLFADGLATVQPNRKGKVEVVRPVKSAPRQTVAPSKAKSVKKGELFYTIQLGIFSSKMKDVSTLSLVPNFQFATNDGKYRLTCGMYKSYESCRKDKDRVVEAGYPGAYIVAYFDGENISLKEASDLLMNPESITFAKEQKVIVRIDQKPNAKRSGNNDIEYRIQIASFRNPAPVSQVATYIEMAGDYGLSDFLDSNGMTVYTVGKFKTYSEAMKARKYLIRNEVPGAFIIAFRGFDKIPLNEAIGITETN